MLFLKQFLARFKTKTEQNRMKKEEREVVAIIEIQLSDSIIVIFGGDLFLVQNMKIVENPAEKVSQKASNTSKEQCSR